MKRSILTIIASVLLIVGCEQVGVTFSGDATDAVQIANEGSGAHNFRKYRISYADESVKSLDRSTRSRLIVNTRVYLDGLYSSTKDGAKHVHYYVSDDELNSLEAKIESYRSQINGEAELLLVDQIIAIYALDRFLLSGDESVDGNISAERFNLIEYYTNDLLRTKSYDIPVLVRGLSFVYEHWPNDKATEAVEYAIGVSAKFDNDATKSDAQTSSLDLLPDHIKTDAKIDSEIRSLNALEKLEMMQKKLSHG